MDGVRRMSEAESEWVDLLVRGAPCTQGFLLLGGEGGRLVSSGVGERRRSTGTRTCGATATKPTVSEQR